MARTPVRSEAAFATLLTSITEDTVTATIHLRLFEDLSSSVAEFVVELNQSPAFWSLTLNAHREVALFRLCRLYDSQRGALSLPSLVDTIRANEHLFEEVRFRERLKDNPFVDSLATGARRPDRAILDRDAASVSGRSDPLVKKLLAIRNRVLAHRDLGVVLRALNDSAGALDPADMGALLDRAATIINRYGSLFRAGTSLMTILGQDDFRRILVHVRNDLATSEAELALEIARAGGDSVNAAPRPQKP